MKEPNAPFTRKQFAAMVVAQIPEGDDYTKSDIEQGAINRLKADADYLILSEMNRTGWPDHEVLRKFGVTVYGLTSKDPQWSRNEVSGKGSRWTKRKVQALVTTPKPLTLEEQVAELRQRVETLEAGRTFPQPQLKRLIPEVRA